MKSGLEEKIRLLETLTDIKPLTEGTKNAPNDVRDYFRINRAAYRRFHSREGFMHFRVTKGDAPSERDIYYQPDAISKYIPDKARVLELGSGQGANLRYLGGLRPDAQFVGADLYPEPLKDAPSNISQVRGDYSSLPQFPDASFDVIFAIETIVYVSDKDRAFQEVRRLLKPSGAFIVYDYALKKPYESCRPLEQTAITLISKCGACAMIEPQSAWEDLFERHGFRRERVEDLSQETLPDLERLARKAGNVLENRPKLAKTLFRLAPRHFTNNIIIGYLGFDSCKDGIIGYMEWAYRKPSDGDGA